MASDSLATPTQTSTPTINLGISSKGPEGRGAPGASGVVPSGSGGSNGGARAFPPAAALQLADSQTASPSSAPTDPQAPRLPTAPHILPPGLIHPQAASAEGMPGDTGRSGGGMAPIGSGMPNEVSVNFYPLETGQGGAAGLIMISAGFLGESTSIVPSYTRSTSTLDTSSRLTSNATSGRGDAHEYSPRVDAVSRLYATSSPPLGMSDVLPQYRSAHRTKPSSTLFISHVPPDLVEHAIAHALRECMPVRIKLHRVVDLGGSFAQNAYQDWMPRGGEWDSAYRDVMLISQRRPRVRQHVQWQVSYNSSAKLTLILCLPSRESHGDPSYPSFHGGARGFHLSIPGATHCTFSRPASGSSLPSTDYAHAIPGDTSREHGDGWLHGVMSESRRAFRRGEAVGLSQTGQRLGGQFWRYTSGWSGELQVGREGGVLVRE